MNNEPTVNHNIYREGLVPYWYDGFYFVFKNSDGYTFHLNPQEHKEELLRPDGSIVSGYDSDVLASLTPTDRKLRVDDFIMNARHSTVFPMDYWDRKEGSMNSVKFNLDGLDYWLKHFTQSDMIKVEMPMETFEAPRPVFGDHHPHIYRSENGMLMITIFEEIAENLNGEPPLPDDQPHVKPEFGPILMPRSVNNNVYNIGYDKEYDYLVVQSEPRTIITNLLILDQSEIASYKEGRLMDIIVRKIQRQKEKGLK